MRGWQRRTDHLNGTRLTIPIPKKEIEQDERDLGPFWSRECVIHWQALEPGRPCVKEGVVEKLFWDSHHAKHG
jgi:hypothetical protein